MECACAWGTDVQMSWQGTFVSIGKVRGPHRLCLFDFGLKAPVGIVVDDFPSFERRLGLEIDNGGAGTGEKAQRDKKGGVARMGLMESHRLLFGVFLSLMGCRGLFVALRVCNPSFDRDDCRSYSFVPDFIAAIPPPPFFRHRYVNSIPPSEFIHHQ